MLDHFFLFFWFLWEIRRFPMLEPLEEYMLAKRWRVNAAASAISGQLDLAAAEAILTVARDCRELFLGDMAKTSCDAHQDRGNTRAHTDPPANRH